MDDRHSRLVFFIFLCCCVPAAPNNHGTMFDTLSSVSGATLTNLSYCPPGQYASAKDNDIYKLLGLYIATGDNKDVS